MELKNKMEAILKERKGLNINDDYGIEKCWNEMTILLTQNEDETIDYLWIDVNKVDVKREDT
ncbi:hypothetical protein [Enterococcus faecalis]|uniref:hypothetical protein n=1 Tax=Enterococcus faecalis TaxID=1351 RepID=UPI002DBF3B7A|nr:hypothetical protein [Enterococcus faecalis]MEB7774311.1 hypothetical protein [Enterococcus faecalis]